MSRIASQARPESGERNNIRAGSEVFFFFSSLRTRYKKKINM
jgi:hypothetical protein